MIGDRMDTDMVAGIETGLYTALVLSGVTDRADIKKFPYRPQLVSQRRRRYSGRAGKVIPTKPQIPKPQRKA